MRDYIFETYLKRLETRVKDLREYYSKLDKADSSDDIKRAFNDVNVELSTNVEFAFRNESVQHLNKVQMLISCSQSDCGILLACIFLFRHFEKVRFDFTSEK